MGSYYINGADIAVVLARKLSLALANIALASRLQHSGNLKIQYLETYDLHSLLINKVIIVSSMYVPSSTFHITSIKY